MTVHQIQGQQRSLSSAFFHRKDIMCLDGCNTSTIMQLRNFTTADASPSCPFKLHKLNT